MIIIKHAELRKQWCFFPSSVGLWRPS